MKFYNLGDQSFETGFYNKGLRVSVISARLATASIIAKYKGYMPFEKNIWSKVLQKIYPLYFAIIAASQFGTETTQLFPRTMALGCFRVTSPLYLLIPQNAPSGIKPSYLITFYIVDCKNIPSVAIMLIKIDSPPPHPPKKAALLFGT